MIISDNMFSTNETPLVRVKWHAFRSPSQFIVFRSNGTTFDLPNRIGFASYLLGTKFSLLGQCTESLSLTATRPLIELLRISSKIACVGMNGFPCADDAGSLVAIFPLLQFFSSVE
jgi:hypothetical protein